MNTITYVLYLLRPHKHIFYYRVYITSINRERIAFLIYLKFIYVIITFVYTFHLYYNIFLRVDCCTKETEPHVLRRRKRTMRYAKLTRTSCCFIYYLGKVKNIYAEWGRRRGEYSRYRCNA